MSQPPQGPEWGNPSGPNPFASGQPPQSGGWPPQGAYPQNPQPYPGQGHVGPGQQGPFGPGQQGPFGPGQQGPGGLGAATKTAGLSTAAKGLIAGGVALAVIGGGSAVAFVTDPLGLRAGAGDWVRQVPASAAVALGVDLSPGAAQQIEMVRFALKFPSVTENLSLTEGGDLRETVFDALVKDKQCNLSFDDDIDPWFGSEVGFFLPAGADGNGVVVLEAQTEAPARAAVEKLSDCGALPAASMAYSDGYLLVGTDEGLAEAAVAEADTSSLADRAEFTEDMAKLDTSGVAMLWADAKGLQDLQALGGDASLAVQPARSSAAVLRFSGGNPELVTVAKATGTLPTGNVTEVGELPADTAAAIGIGGGREYVPQIQEALTSQGIDVTSGTGLQMPEDLETLLGDDFIIAADRFDPSGIEDPTQIPVGLRIQTDPSALRSLEQRLNTTDIRISHLDQDNTNFLSLSPTYAQKLQAPAGNLADQPGFKAAVAEPGKAQAVVYINIAAFSDLLVNELGTSSDSERDLQALEAFGMSAWNDGDDYQRGVLRLTAR